MITAYRATEEDSTAESMANAFNKKATAGWAPKDASPQGTTKLMFSLTLLKGRDLVHFFWAGVG